LNSIIGWRAPMREPEEEKVPSPERCARYAHRYAACSHYRAESFRALLRAIEDYQGTPETRAVLELLALTFVRPGELRAAEWTEIDLDAAVWEIPAGRMKMRKSHCVPLAARAVSILKELHKLTGQCKLLFPSVRSVALHVREHPKCSLASHGL
jgi:integrase